MMIDDYDRGLEDARKIIHKLQNDDQLYGMQISAKAMLMLVEEEIVKRFSIRLIKNQ